MSDLTSFVVDASLGVKWFVDESDSERAAALISDPAAVLHVPDLFFIECANVLWKKVRRGEYSAEDAAGDLADIRAMELVVTSTADLAERALVIACSNEVSAYDACYVALAESVGVPLVTADGRLAAKLEGSSHQIVTLGSL